MKFNVTEDLMTGEYEFGPLNISGDETQGYRPFQLMVASLAGCSALVYKRILEKQKVAYEDMTIEAEVERSDDSVRKIEKVTLTFKVTGKDLNQEKLQKSLHTASNNCSMVQSVVPSMEVEEIVEIIEA
ncbi:OsmC family protein [Halalkalibacillus halophilus]|uniref:OsmC family protein n=1 Tax=Halalkalibacillus halophilus TaxID=392827 RepID=UPI00041CFFCA|nr:OsmC family protein [Halalkalibacillus halophilus]